MRPSYPGYFPFDILLVVFSYYEEILPKYPLETLLLVCRSWNTAALECKHIWSNLVKVDIRVPAAALYWAFQIPLRIKRSGLYSPINFTLHLEESWGTHIHPQCMSHIREGKQCECSRTLRENLKVILRGILVLDGEDGLMSRGSLCARWNRVEIRLIDSKFPINFPFFSYPTPQLTSLILQDVQIYNTNASAEVVHAVIDTKLPFLPSAPRLEHIEIIDCNLPLPNPSKAKLIRLIDHSRENIPMVLSRLDCATHVQTLHLGVSRSWNGGGGYKIPTNLPFLETLHLDSGGDNILPQNIDEVHLPALRNLSLVFDGYEGPRNGRPLQTLLGCHGIPFHQIETLYIEFGNETYSRHRNYALEGAELAKESKAEHWNRYKALLKACPGLKRLSGNNLAIIFFLKLLKEDCVEKGEGVFTNHSFILTNDKRVERRLSVGKEQKLYDIDFLAISLGLLEIEDNRRDFLEHFHAGLVYRHRWQVI